MWVCALDRLLERSTNYVSRRNDPQGRGQFLQGLRRARNAIIHGDVVIDVAESADIPNSYTPGR
jgi:hypothetical protein